MPKQDAEARARLSQFEHAQETGHWSAIWAQTYGPTWSWACNNGCCEAQDTQTDKQDA